MKKIKRIQKRNKELILKFISYRRKFYWKPKLEKLKPTLSINNLPFVNQPMVDLKLIPSPRKHYIIHNTSYAFQSYEEDFDFGTKPFTFL